MPYMRVSLSAKLTEEQKQSLYEKLGEALRHIPGKEPFMLIAEIADGLQFYAFGKKQENFAFVDARYFSRVEYHAKRDFAVAVMKAIEETAGTKSTNISMNIFELSTWGGFGDLNDEFYKDPGADENRQSAHGEGED
ncbi:MAG: hypothetical protein IKP17_04025 [Oscillospiraceae bacterium]|nr:hypothetical protein [Oscillospiraceae bacterium]